MVSRQAADHGAIQEVAANEREVANGLLTNAAKKIEELENQLRQKDLEIITLHETSARGSQRPAFAPAVNLPASPPPSSRKRSSLEDEKADILMSTCSWELNLAAHGSPLPPDRTEELASLPEVEVTLGPGHTIPAIFSRQSVSNALGGSIQGLVVRCTESATPLARKHGIQDYLCPNMDHNAWSPAGPGKHGFIQVGLGRDRKLFNGEGDYRHVFVGAGKHLIYCGWYHVLRVEPLTKDEWETLPAKVKSTYSETTMSKEKNRELKSAQNVLRMYNSGELRAPCVRLQCVKFDTEFYHELVRANDQFFEHKPRPTPQTRSVGVKMSKRRKVIKSNAEVDMDVESSEDEVSLAVALRVRNATSSQFATAMSVAPSSAQSPVPALPPPDATAIPVDPAPTAPLTPAASRSSVATAAVDCASSPFSAGSSVVSLTVGRRQTMSSTKSQSVPSDTQPGPMKIRIPGGRAAPAPSLSLDEREDPDQYLVESLSESDSDDMYADDLVYKRLSSS
ncbi:hypothetical protein C8Q78DRAFT_627832 [Trametes maxima]|nr:hypothetical protein C8Q78DRAFT_627832 [Trametes maxima]